MYCRNCGSEVTSDDIFCYSCGNQIDKIEDTNNISISTNNEKTNAQKEESPIWGIIIFISLIGLIIIYGPAFMDWYMDDTSSDALSIENSYYSGNSYNTQISQKEKNVQICEQVASEYSETHTYIDDGVFDCDNMAMDVWNLIESQGINAQIAVGNVDMSDESLEDMNHAWVLAEVAPQSWVAIECTGGYVTYDEEYYSGWFFDTPKNYQSFLDLYNDWQYQYQDYENYRDYYNEFVDIYNDADYFEQLGMESGMAVAKNTLEEKERVFLRTDAELDALLEYG